MHTYGGEDYETKHWCKTLCNVNYFCSNDTCYFSAIGGYNMSKAQETEEDRKAIEEWLKNNEVTICPPEERTPEDELVYIYKVGKRK